MYRYCLQCGKATKMCICSLITSIKSNVELIILQHSSEVHQPKGTARILKLSLENSQILIGENFSEDKVLNELLAEDRVITVVLYPGEFSTGLEELIAKQQASKNQTEKPVKWRVILLDGTWKKAYKMWRLSINLHSLPCIALPEDLSGNYRMRKAPSANSLSTVEAGFHILTILDAKTDYQPLIDVFDQMVDKQMAHIPPELRAKHFFGRE
ncbi:tRNA-uridine aminocarboxypropyltransferase [Vibrio tapetis subsp. quintayensis]|uniref:tRNA-uridine aminocarboxypropyltransferase n=1 Tax=Vibrio tapetis TaxID=52443 RepID=UPI0025B5A420|nr:tRNA-uridine aminocarboxypropyltransferase [Vibrio tapetis]MDN3682247.1 tRNA-uridine aminocarboxypropyltransferase [Vibrio tapetis subsp. quintayensis]